MKRSTCNASVACGLAATLLIGSCSSDVATLGLGEVTNRFSLTVSVTNVGNGFGTVDVTFSAGPAQNPCTQVLGPGDNCRPFVVANVRPERAEISVEAEAGSIFIGWADANCSGTSTECTVLNRAGDFDNVIEVQPRFDLDPAP